MTTVTTEFHNVKHPEYPSLINLTILDWLDENVGKSTPIWWDSLDRLELHMEYCSHDLCNRASPKCTGISWDWITTGGNINGSPDLVHFVFRDK
jgi:hypothetical protein